MNPAACAALQSKSSAKVHANREFMCLLRPMWLAVTGAILALVGLTAVNMTVPILVGNVFSRVFPERNWTLLWTTLGGLAVLFVTRNLLFYHSKITAMKVGENVCFTLRTRLFERLQQKSLTYTRQQNPGRLSGRIMNDSFLIQQFIQEVLPQFIQAALLFIGVLGMIYLINWPLALASTFVLPLHFLANRYFGGMIRKTSRRSQENLDFATSNIIEKLLGVEVVKGFSGESRENRAFQQAIEHSRRSQLEGSRYIVMQKVVADLLVCAGTLVLIALGAYQVIGRSPDVAMQSGEFIAFFWYIRLLYPTVIDLMSSGGKLAKAQASIDRAFELLRDTGDQEPSAARLKPEIKGAIEFDRVGFSYERPGGTERNPVLREVCFNIDCGSVCAITGPSGSGKTTLVSLLPLLFAPESGTIRIDGIDTLEMDLSHLRQSIGVVFQECFLFNTTIMENLRYARPGLAPKKIIEICKQTGADGVIRQLPGGYNTIVGENGMNLSRGQKQLITITRAVIKDPKILILDEATASLDPDLEAIVVPTILNLMRGRTTMMITHNHKLLEHADCELQIRAGQVISFNRMHSSGKAAAGGGAVARTAAGAARMLAAACCLGALAFAPLRAAAADIPLYELATHRVRLSHISPERCISALQLYGFTIGAAGQPVAADKLPVIIHLPSTGHHNSLPKIPGNFPPTESDPIGELVVFYHPSHPEQLARVVTLIHRDIDLPARQIMLEAMVLEISEGGLKQLGVEWERSPDSAIELGTRMKEVGRDATISFGTLGKLISMADPTLTLAVTNLFDRYRMKLEALIVDGQAEVLSRPSVLTLDNRMAYINVAEQIPIAQSTFHAQGQVSTVSFREREAGIQLAIRPRISDDGEEVSLQVSANVSAVVPGRDVEILDKDGANVIARSPTISVREVQTYARIANNTPFIIGGLISRDDVKEQRRVPILSKIPWLGRAFQSERASRQRREVIIVITPYVLPETGRELVSRNLPLDSDLFDSFGNRLFRDSYRIRAEDVYNLDFIETNQELHQLQAQVDAAVAKNNDLATQYPYSSFVGGRFPGEEALVIRQIYSAIRNVGLDSQVNPDRFIFFEQVPDSTVSIRVTRLRDFLERTADRLWAEDHAGQRVPRRPRSVWDAIGNRAIALVFTNRRDDELGRVFSEPVPEIKIFDCAGSARFDELVWELNQPDENGLDRAAIVLRRERDVRRLQQAVATRETIDLNAPEAGLSVKQFQTGRQLLLPRRAANRHDLIDGRIAEIWMITDRYYDVLKQAFETDRQALGNALEEKP